MKTKITLTREILDDPDFLNGEQLRIFLALLFAADENGEVDIGLRSFAAANGTTYQRLRTIIKNLVSTHKLTHKSTHKLTHITICELERYTEVQRTNQRTNQRTEKAAKSVPKSNVPALDFVDERFAEAWGLWVDYRKEVGKKYKSERSARIGYNQMVEKSGNNPQTALAMVKQSIANTYQGLFAVKDKNNDRRQQNNGSVGGTTDRYSVLERAAATILCSGNADGFTYNDKGGHA